MFEGKSIIVTGAASGIGRAAAILFARNGGRVVVSDVNEEGGEETVALIGKESRGEARFVACDIANEEQVRHLAQATIDAYGRLDCACNNAGIEGLQSPTHEITNDNWDRIININLRGTWLCMKHEIPHMLKTASAMRESSVAAPGTPQGVLRGPFGGCSIVNISSIAGLIGLSGIAAYCASKHGMNGLTKAAAVEYAKQGIRINAICPGAIQTPMIERFTHHEKQQAEDLAARHPIGRFGTPEEVAEAIIWLCSDAASFVTGQTLAVDGGYVAQ